MGNRLSSVRDCGKHARDMLDDDIQKLFQGLIEQVGENADDGTYRMFRLLITTTLRCRDNLRSQGIALTVGETQAALTAFMDVMKTHSIPDGLSANAQHLVIEWLKEIKENVHH